MATQRIDNFSDQRPAGVFDVTFEGDGWGARGWVPSNLPVTIVVMDGDKEICRGTAAFVDWRVSRNFACLFLRRVHKPRA